MGKGEAYLVKRVSSGKTLHASRFTLHAERVSVQWIPVYSLWSIVYGLLLLAVLPSCTLDKANRDDRVNLTFSPPTGGTTGGTTGGGTDGGTTGSVNVGGAEDFNPSTSETPFESPEETADEEPAPPAVCEFSVSQSSINFGINQVGERECATITVPECVTGTAEIDDSSSVDGEAPEFTLSSGTLSSGFTVCYERLAVGNHTGRINIIGMAGTAPVAHAISLSGRTSPVLFSISEPVPDQLVYECDGVSTSVEGGFSIPASGRVEEELESLFSSREVTISSGGQSANFPVGNDLGFSGTAFVPGTPSIYPINFSMTTSRGVLQTSVNVIRFTGPDGTVEVRDGVGNLVSVAEPSPESTATDDQGLKIGVAVANIAVSGPRADHPVRISIKITGPDNTVIKTYAGDGEWVDGDVEAEPVLFHSQFFAEGANADRACPATFTNSAFAYCVSLPPLAELPRGANRITATLQSAFTDCAGPFPSYSTTVIIDNSLPVIEIQTPRDNKIYDTTAHVILEGIVRNYTPPTGEGVDQVCPLKMWLNSPVKPETEKTICPTVVQDIETDPSTGNQGNVRRGRFRVDLTERYPSLLQFYTNLAHLRVANVRGHVALKTVSFQRGKFHPSTFSSLASGEESVLVGDIKTGNIGDIAAWNGTTRKAPIMVNISEGTLTNLELTAVIEKFLNDPEDGLKFADIIQGGKLPGDENGNNQEDEGETIDFESALELEDNQTFWDLSDKRQEQWIWQNLHGSMPQKVRALSRYRVEKALRGEADPGDLENVVFRGSCEERTREELFDPETGWNLACDSCRNKIPTALVTYDTYQYIFKDIHRPISSVTDVRPEWPSIFGDSLNVKDIRQGKWKIGKLDLKNNGYLDLDLCLVGRGDVVDGCEDVPDDNDHEPAFWGHMAAIGLISGGITGLENDPLLPLIWNISKVRLKLTDVLQIKKEKLSDGTYTNRVVVYKDKIDNSINGSIRLAPFLECADYYKNLYGENVPTPFGCNPRGNIYPILIDRSATSGEAAWADLGDEGENTWLLEVLRIELLKTFKNILSCIVEERVNPIINSVAFVYPPWVPEDDRIIDLTMALDNTDGEITFEQLDDPPDPENPQNPVFTLRPDFAMSDIFIDDGSLQLKLLAEIGASRVPVGNLADLVSRPGFRDLGYMYRMPGEFDFDSTYPLTEFETIPYASISVGIEEVLHSATHLLFRKGFRELIEMIDQETADKLDMPGNWTIGIDKVIFGRFDVCEKLNGVLETDLPPTILLGGAIDINATATHLDLTLDKNFPPTLLMKPVAGDPDAVQLDVGLSNIRLDIKRLVGNDADGYSVGCSAEEREVDPTCDRPVISLRLDGILQLTVKYRRESRRLEIYIHPIISMPIYLSVLNRGSVFNEYLLIQELENTLLPSQKLAKITSVYDPTTVFDPSVEFDATREETFYAPSVYLALPDRVTGFEELEAVQTAQHTPDPNGVCNEEHPAPRYADETTMMMRAFFAPRYQKAVLGKNLANSRRYGGLGGMSPNIDINPFDDLDLESLTSCVFTSGRDGEAGGNDINEDLCDLGIDDITFGTGYPHLIFDTDNGYLHLSTKILLQVYEWLEEEVAVEE